MILPWLLSLAMLVAQDAKPKKPAPVAPEIETDKLIARVEEIAKEAIEKEGVPGLSIAVAREDEILISKGWGYADAARHVPARDETPYAIGSLTRQFTAVGILQLVDAGKLALETPLSKLLPAFPVGEHKVTLEHLLANTSGIPGWSKILAKHPEVATKSMSEGDFFKLFADVPFDFEPGADFALDSANYVLLSMIVAKTSGVDYAAYVRKNIIEPVGLTRTDFCPDGQRPLGFADDCKELAPGKELEIPMPAAPAYATQSLCSNVLDLVKWQRALVQRAVFSEHASRLIMTPTKLSDGNSTNYGYALAMSRLGDFKSYSHTGGVGGFRVRLAYYSLPHVTIAVLANCASAPVERIERDIARFVLALPAPGVVDLPVPAAELAYCAGMYQIATTQIRIVEKDGHLQYVRAGENPVALKYQGSLVFTLATDADTRVTFVAPDPDEHDPAKKDAVKKCASFAILRGGFVSTARRME
jgi:D-alanyl-D-alanine carboxypeptidase